MSFKNIMIVVLVIIALVATSVAVYVVISSREKEEPILTMDFYEPQIKTNLRDSRQIVVISFQLEYQDKALTELITLRDTQIRDMILSVLRSKSPKDIDGTEGQEKVKQELIRGFMRVLESDRILNIYFKEFFVTG